MELVKEGTGDGPIQKMKGNTGRQAGTGGGTYAATD